MLAIPRKVTIDKIIDKINDSAIYKKFGLTKKDQPISNLSFDNLNLNTIISLS